MPRATGYEVRPPFARGPARPAARRSCHLLLPAAGELERSDAGAPGSDHDRVGRQVLLRVPEGAVVARVDGQVAVVAPAALDLRLRTGARVRHLLGPRHLPERVAGRP